MKKLITATAVVFMIIFTAGFASAVTAPLEITTTPGDGFLYFYQVAASSSTAATLIDTGTGSLTFGLTLFQADSSASPIPYTTDGTDLFSGTLTLPVGTPSDGVPAEVVFNVSAIDSGAVVVDGLAAEKYAVTGTNGTITVTASVLRYTSKQADRTIGSKAPYPSKKTDEINGFVTGNGTNFNGAFHGKLYE